jgi:methionine synthase II (cobalamin-independent)
VVKNRCLCLCVCLWSLKPNSECVFVNTGIRNSFRNLWEKVQPREVVTSTSCGLRTTSFFVEER